jgi:hypothetical protein
VSGSGTTQLDLTNLIVGPGIQANSAIVGQLLPWAPSTTWTTNATWSGNYRQIGQFVEYFAEASFTGATDATNLEIDLPSGHVISSTFFVGDLSDKSTISSSGSVSTSTDNHRASIAVVDNATVKATHAGNASDKMEDITNTDPVTIASGSTFRIEFKLPIVAFEGAGTINVNTPDVEYIYNTNLTDTDNSTSFGYGAEGTQFGSYTALRFQRVRSKYVIGPSDRKELQFTGDGGLTWENYEQGANVSTRTEQNGVSYGAFMAPVNQTDIDVYFGQYPRATGATYGSAGVTWAASGIGSNANFKWRVAIFRGPSPVGFSSLSQTQSGLVKRAGQLLGTNTDDSAEAGHVGETLRSTATATPSSITTAVVHNYIQRTLTPGEWHVKASAIYSASTAITDLTRLLVGLSTSSSSFTDSFGIQTIIQRPSGGQATGEDIFGQVTSGTYKVPFGSTTTVYLNTYSEYTGGQLQITSGDITATRIR